MYGLVRYAFQNYFVIHLQCTELRLQNAISYTSPTLIQLTEIIWYSLLIKMTEDCWLFFEKFRRLSEDHTNVSDESLNFYRICMPLVYWEEIVKLFYPIPVLRTVHYVAKHPFVNNSCAIPRIINGYPNLTYWLLSSITYVLQTIWYFAHFATKIHKNVLTCNSIK